MSSTSKNISYRYGNLPIPGGGYVSGFLFHPTVPDILYCRTDIGGCYRYDFQNDSWISLVEHVSHFDLSETFPLAIALDPRDPSIIYSACGLGHAYYGKYPNGILACSDDYGATWTTKEIPCHVHGNNVGRGTGCRLVVDPVDSNVIYFASQEGGLLRSGDKGDSWESIKVCTESHPENELNLAFVWVSPNGKTIVVSSSGLSNKEADDVRGHSLYVSYDRGNSFKELTQPEYNKENKAKLKGLVGHRYDFDGKHLYITMNQTGPYAYLIESGYSCSCGDVTDGYILRYPFNSDGTLGEPEDISPEYDKIGLRKGNIYCGFGGICSSPQKPGYIVASTICNHAGDCVFVSMDYGNTWEVKLFNLEVGNLRFNTSYMKPEYNGGVSLIHWLSDIKINPFNPDMVFFNSGTGVFASMNLLQDDFYWSDHCKGIEETVHLNVYAPVCGDITALDIVGDLGGFVFTDINKPCENTFADEKNDRYITSINADYPDTIPNVFAATPRGNWTSRTCGGVVYSEDAGKTLRHCAMPYGLTDEIDRRLKHISKPNNNSGWIAMSSDSQRLVWAIADGGNITSDCVVYSEDKGFSFKKSSVTNLNGEPAEGNFKPFFDRCNSNYCYGFGENSRLYVSRDGGKTFCEKQSPDTFPKVFLSGIDAACDVEIRGFAGTSGKFIMAMNTNGLWELSYDICSDRFTARKLSSGDDAVFCIGLGIMPDTTEYINNDKAFYINGIIDGVYGFYRSLDYGKTWTKINTDSQRFGEIKSIDADKRVFGRYFIATGTRGLKYGCEA